MTDERRAAEAKRTNESSKRRLMMGFQGKKAKRQATAAPIPSAGVNPEDQTLADRLRQLNAETASAGTATASMDMWLCMKRAITAAAKFAEMTAALESAQLTVREVEEAKEMVQVALEESERAKALEIEAVVREAIRSYRLSTEFSILLDKEVGSEMADLLYRFKRYNPGRELNLNFITDPPPLPEGLTEEMIEDYEGEDATEEAFAAEGSVPADAVAAEGANADGEEAAA
ncbi:unnamed protein product [Prunus brigantina]